MLRLSAHGGMGILYWARKILYLGLGVLYDLCHQIAFGITVSILTFRVISFRTKDDGN